MSRHPVFKAGNTALITGAASGIGLAVAHLCKNQGMKLALVDNNTHLLSEAKKQLSGDTETYPMDVSKIEEWRGLRERVGRVDFLMLNAGIGVKGGWDDVEYFHKVHKLLTHNPHTLLLPMGTSRSSTRDTEWLTVRSMTRR